MTDKAERIRRRTEVSKQNFRYNRFLLLRYSLAALFFSNIYWGIALYLSQQLTLLLPLGLLVVSILAISDHVRLYGENGTVSPNLQWNYYYYLLQVITNIFLIVITALSSQFVRFYPFLKNTRDARMVSAAVLFIGLGLSITCLKRISAINKNQDKHYQYIKEFENAYK